uniref:ShKT domain-containing protein n=2 Tax=Meloidogyne TaxID=189290 RepID=A0A914KPU7_MELIC
MITKLITLIPLILILILNFPRLINTQSAVCPIGFVWGGRKGISKAKGERQPILVLDPDPGRSPGLSNPCLWLWNSLPTFSPALSCHRLQCLRGSCCRDQRPLAARLGPIIYPQDLISIYGFGGFGGNGFGFSPGIGGFGGLIPGGLIPGGFGGFGGGFGGICFDTALNCFSYVAYCVVPIYRLCMITRCARTCGACRGGLLGGAQRGIGRLPLGGNGIIPGGVGGLNGLNGLGGIGGIG